MIALNERTVLSVLVGIIGVSTLFCLLSFVTSGWGGVSVFNGGRSSTAAMLVLSFILLIGSLVVTGLVFGNVIPHPQLPLIVVGLLFVTCIFLIGAVGSIFDRTAASKLYSPSLLMVSLSFGYFSSLLSVYWFFGVRGSGDQGSSSSGTPRSKPAQVAMSEGNY